MSGRNIVCYDWPRRKTCLDSTMPPIYKPIQLGRNKFSIQKTDKMFFICLKVIYPDSGQVIQSGGARNAGENLLQHYGTVNFYELQLYFY